jgi:hypothetical protein
VARQGMVSVANGVSLGGSERRASPYRQHKRPTEMCRGEVSLISPYGHIAHSIRISESSLVTNMGCRTGKP